MRKLDIRVSNQVGHKPVWAAKDTNWMLKILDFETREIKLTRQRKRQMSRVKRKPVFCICENKDTDQLTAKLISVLFSLHR